MEKIMVSEAEFRNTLAVFVLNRWTREEITHWIGCLEGEFQKDMRDRLNRKREEIKKMREILDNRNISS